MRFELPRDIARLSGYLPEFLTMVGGGSWWKRVNQLDRDARRSPYQTKIVTDHHWLEMELSAQISILRDHGHLLPNEVFPHSMATLRFAGMVVEIHRRMTAAGRAHLAGRLRDGLKSDFAGLYLEMEMALSLLDDGNDVEFPDFEGTASYDLRFRNDVAEGEVECKSLSADAGRKIHRKDFYRFIDALGPILLERAKGDLREILVVTLDDRLPSDTANQKALRAAADRVFREPKLQIQRGAFFTVELEPFDHQLTGTQFANSQEFYAVCRKAFGDGCHVSGVMGQTGGCLVVVRSQREDDHSKPQLEAMKKAVIQLSGERPGFIAMQYEDIEPPDLTLPHLRRRASLLANAVFHAGHTALAAVYYCAYNGLHASDGMIAKPAFVCWNPKWNRPTEGLPFRRGLSNSAFAIALGVNPTKTDPDDHLYGTGL